jgi:hypothetical protein
VLWLVIPAKAGIQFSVIPAQAGIQFFVIPAKAGIQFFVIPAQAGIQFFAFDFVEKHDKQRLDSSFRWNDEQEQSRWIPARSARE